MKLLACILSVCLAATLASACATPAPSVRVAPVLSASMASGYRSVSPEEAKKQMESEAGIVLLDVRTAEEYAEGHIAGAVLLPVDDVEALAAGTLPDKDAVLFVYCRSGRRSKIAVDQLVNMGYTQVYDLGGIIDWPYEIEK